LEGEGGRKRQTRGKKYTTNTIHRTEERRRPVQPTRWFEELNNVQVVGLHVHGFEDLNDVQVVGIKLQVITHIEDNAKTSNALDLTTTTTTKR
jgi:hypothetical protein